MLDKRVTLRMSSDLHRKITALADMDKRSINQYIVMVLEGHVEGES